MEATEFYAIVGRYVSKLTDGLLDVMDLPDWCCEGPMLGCVTRRDYCKAALAQARQLLADDIQD